MSRVNRNAIAAALVAAAATVLIAAPQPARRTGTALQIRPITWSEAMPIVDRLEDALPPSLREIPRSERPARWTAWLGARRQALAARVAQGDVDSVVNLLLFGTSFTKEPRITARLLKDLDQRWKAGDRSVQDTLTRQYQQRAVDLIAAAASPRAGERMQDVRRVLAAHGHVVTTEAGRRSAVDFLFTNLARVGEEAAKLASELEAARRAADPTAAFAERSRIFRDRGLAGDSSLLTQFAVDRGVCGLRDRGVAAAGSITRVAVIGPGLDFADKQEGFDFYPPQSLQPFTLADSLIRCGLASRDALQITTLDISPRVNAHLRAAVTRAASRKAAHRLVLPWTSDAGWTDDALETGRRGHQPGIAGPESGAAARRAGPHAGGVADCRREAAAARGEHRVGSAGPRERRAVRPRAGDERPAVLRHLRADAGTWKRCGDAAARRRAADERWGAGDPRDPPALAGLRDGALLGSSRRW